MAKQAFHIASLAGLKNKLTRREFSRLNKALQSIAQDPDLDMESLSIMLQDPETQMGVVRSLLDLEFQAGALKTLDDLSWLPRHSTKFMWGGVLITAASGITALATLNPMLFYTVTIPVGLLLTPGFNVAVSNAPTSEERREWGERYKTQRDYFKKAVAEYRAPTLQAV